MKYEIHETRTVTYAIEITDSMTAADLQASKLDSMRLWARGRGWIIAEQAAISYTVKSCSTDDDNPADVQLDARLRDLWPPEG